MSVDDLYERDFYVWTQDQAAAIRALAKGRQRGSNALDYERLADEVEGLGKTEYREVRSFTARIIEHLFKLAWSTSENPKPGWRSEILVFRRELEAALTPTIRRRVEDELEKIHLSAASVVAEQFTAHEPDSPQDAARRWTWDQIVSGNNIV